MWGPAYEARVTSVRFRDLMRRFLRQIGQLPQDVINNIVAQLRTILFEFQSLTESLSDATRKALR
mgnify:CR=1 FL=1|jgi:hypothetical protein